MKPSLAFDVAGRAAERALAIEPTFGPAFIELALAKFGGDWDWEGAEQAFRRALALDAANPLAHVHYSWLLMLLGRREPAFAEAQRAPELAPSSRFVAAARAPRPSIWAANTTPRSNSARNASASTRLHICPAHSRAVLPGKGERDGAIRDLEQAAARGIARRSTWGFSGAVLRPVRHARQGARARRRVAQRPS